MPAERPCRFLTQKPFLCSQQFPELFQIPTLLLLAMYKLQLSQRLQLDQITPTIITPGELITHRLLANPYINANHLSLLFTMFQSPTLGEVSKIIKRPLWPTETQPTTRGEFLLKYRSQRPENQRGNRNRDKTPITETNPENSTKTYHYPKPICLDISLKI